MRVELVLALSVVVRALVLAYRSASRDLERAIADTLDPRTSPYAYWCPVGAHRVMAGVDEPDDWAAIHAGAERTCADHEHVLRAYEKELDLRGEQRPV